jgi:hypothetical protein
MDAQALGFIWSRAPGLRHGFVQECVTPASPANPLALSFLETWRKLALRGEIVIGRDFPTRRFVRVLPDVLLLEKVQGDDFRIRLAGFAVQCFHGRTLGGRHLSEIYGARDCRELGAVLASGCPHVLRASLRRGAETVGRHEIVSVPITASDGCTPLVLAVSFWSDRFWLN